MEPFWAGIAPPAHIAQFYERDAALIDTLVGFIGDGLKVGESTVIIATGEHLNALEQGLIQSGVNLAAARDDNRYIALPADAALSIFMIDNWPDEQIFVQLIELLIRRAKVNGCRVRAFGEMVALLWAKGHSRATVRLEHLWNELCEKHDFPLLCAYPKQGFANDSSESLAKICAAHSQVV